jgi:uncharacterized membrane protein
MLDKILSNIAKFLIFEIQILNAGIEKLILIKSHDTEQNLQNMGKIRRR